MKKKKKPAKESPVRRRRSVPAPKRLPAPKGPPFRPEVHVAPDLNVLTHDAADLFVEVARRSLLESNRFTVCLSGGTAARGLFRLLCQEPFRSQVPWKKTFLFWGDERHVPQDSPESHFKTAWDWFLSKVPVPRGQVYPMTNGSGPVDRAAEKYEKLLKAIWGSKDVPRFDFNLMGMGEEGRTAGLFPGAKALGERKRWAVGYKVDASWGERVSLTFPVFNAAKMTVVLIEGAVKARMLKDVLEGRSEPPRYPVQHLRPRTGRLIFMLDANAAALTKWDSTKE
jgi:6-phosphogluconolactonase